MKNKKYRYLSEFLCIYLYTYMSAFTFHIQLRIKYFIFTICDNTLNRLQMWDEYVSCTVVMLKHLTLENDIFFYLSHTTSLIFQLNEKQKIPHCRNVSKYHIVGTFPDTTLSERFQIPHCWNVCGIWKRSDSVVFGNVPTVWYLEAFWQCGIWKRSNSVVFGNVSTVWYLENNLNA
jgi:hypothetical protein